MMRKGGVASPARVVAVRTLLALERDSEVLASEQLAMHVEEEKLSSEDTKLARTLVFGVLRRAVTLDHLYERFLTRRRSIGMALRLIFRLGAFQKYFLARIPAYAIVNDSVELARREMGLSSQEVGFVNAVLRKVAGDESNVADLLPEGNKTSALAIRYSFPQQVVRLLVEKFGGPAAAAIMESANTEPAMTIRCNTLRTTAGELSAALAEEGFQTRPGLLAPEAMIVDVDPQQGSGPRVSLFETRAFQDGWFYAQDEGSQLVAHVALSFGIPGCVLDLCAAPGGKTTHLAELTRGEVEIVATDASERRLNLVRENVRRLGTPGVRVLSLEDVMSLSSGKQEFGLVLVDAPCSGFGTVRRNPEVRYRITAERLQRHQERQLEVLRLAAGFVAPGGFVAYSTCSVSDQENWQVVSRFLKENSNWRVEDAAPMDGAGLLASLQGKRSGVFATWPKWTGIDGFEAAVLRRNS